MDELAVVEPHGPDRIVATTTRRRSPALVAVMGRMRGDDSGALERAPARRRHARRRHDHARRLRRVGAQPPLPPDRRAVRARRIPRPLLEPNRPPMAAKRPSSFVCITRAGLTVVGRPRADLGLRRRSRGSSRRWPPRSRRTRCSRGPIAASSRRTSPLAMVARRRVRVHARRRRAAHDRQRHPDQRDVQQLLPTSSRDAPHVLRTAVVPVVGDGQRAAARARRALDRRRDRGVVGRGASTRRSARSARASCCSSRSPRSARAAGCCITIVYAFAVGDVPRSRCTRRR